jgi:hypothetical protein
MRILLLAQSDFTLTLQDRVRRVLEALGLAGLDLLLAVAVLLIGWVLATLASKLVQWLLRAARFNEALRGLAGPSGIHWRLEPAAAISWAVHWVIVLVGVMVAADLLGLDLSASVGDRMRDILPRVVSATIVLGVGVLVAIGVGAVVRALLTGAGVKGSRLRAQLVVAVLVGFATLLSLEQLGLAAQFIMALGLTAVAAVGLGVALAFGLGCRDLARDLIVEYLRATEEEPAPRERA